MRDNQVTVIICTNLVIKTSVNDMKKVLVLGHGDEDKYTLEFVNSFGIHLKFDNYKDALEWQSNLFKVKVVNGIKNSMVIIGNERFNFIHATTPYYPTQQIISVLLSLLHKQKVSAIIFLVNPSKMKNEHVWKYKYSILSKLNQFADKNVLYLVMANNDSYKQEQFILNSFGKKERGVFYFQEDVFCNLSKKNWQENVEFSKSIYNYIVGDENTNGLQGYFIQSVIPVPSMLKLADDLLEFLILIYICSEAGKLSRGAGFYNYFYIRNYKNNVTACYDNNCIKWEKHHFHDKLKLKIPKICHDPCKCYEFYNDVNRCTIFDTSDKTCLQCNCKSGSHSKNCFEFSFNCDIAISDIEKRIAMKILTTFYLYKKQNQQVCHFENIFLRLLDMQDTKHQTIFDNFKIEFNEKIQKFDEKCKAITSKNMLLCLKELYEIKESSRITPEVMEDIFSKDFHIEIIPEYIKPNEETEIPKINNDVMEMVDDENAELKQMKEMLGLIKNNSTTGQNINPKLNSASTSNINLNQNIIIPKMSGDEIKKVLVIGAPSDRVSTFINTFGTYLQCTTHEEAIKWQPNLTSCLSTIDDIDITTTTMQIENKTFNFIHHSYSDDFYASNQVILILLHYLQRQKLTAIIFLVHPTPSGKYDEHGVFKSCLFSGSEQFAKNNILYVCNNEQCDSRKIREYLDASKVDRNIFYFQESAFYKISEANWQQFVKFCKSIYNYIVGNEIINGLPDYYVQSLIPEKCALKLVNDLTILLIQIYICAEYSNISNRLKNRHTITIKNFKKYVTVCYDCGTWMQNDENIKMKIPGVCHVPCKCTHISTCTLFTTIGKLCFKCDHDIESHTQYSLQFDITVPDAEYKTEKQKAIAIKTLSTFFLYKEQNQEKYDVKTICMLLLDMNDSSHSSIFRTFETQFDQEVHKIEKESDLITRDTILMCLYQLNQQIDNYAILEYLNDILPKECRLEIMADKNNSKKHLTITKECEIPSVNDNKIEIETLRNENVGMKQMLQNANDLNSKLIQDMQTLTERCRPNQKKKEPKKKKNN